jgi:hypothetical protein
MPTICKKDTCRNKAVYGFFFGKPLFCSAHREDGSQNTRTIETRDKIETTIDRNSCTKCSTNALLPRFKGFCKRCYIETYPADPLSLQYLYKSKEDVIQKFIDSKFDGFVHKEGSSQIQINGFILKVVYIIEQDVLDHDNDEKIIVIKFNPNKYANGKNPMLYTRLPDLEKEISRQFERIMGGMEKENAYLFFGGGTLNH